MLAARLKAELISPETSVFRGSEMMNKSRFATQGQTGGDARIDKILRGPAVA